MDAVEVARPDVLDVLEPGYGPLFDRTVRVFLDDARVRAMWLSGSLARGTADVVSDLDVLIAVADDQRDRFAQDWREWLRAITPTVIARPLPFLPGSLYCVTEDRERLDIIVEPVSAIDTTGFRHRLVVFDRDDLDSRVPSVEPGAGPSPERISYLIEEFFRDYGMFPVVVARQDWLLGQEAIHFLRSLLYQLFVEENAPLPPMGVKQWTAKLNEHQAAVLTALPAGGTDPESFVAAHEAVAVAFVSEARRIAAAHNVAWPDELERATRRYLEAWDLPSLR